MSYYISCLVLFLLLAIIWSYADRTNLLIKVTFIGMAVWTALRLFGRVP